MCDVIWCHTDENGMAVLWASVIAFASALVVAYAAYRVGRRQADIFIRQTAIQAELTRIEADKMKADLFDKRFAVYQAVADFVGETTSLGHPPGFGGSALSEPMPERDRKVSVAIEFLVALDKSKLLFSETVYQDLERLRKRANYFHADYEMLEPTKREGGPVELYAQRLKEHQAFFVRVRESLSDFFGPELSVGSRFTGPALLTDNLNFAEGR